MSALPEWPIGPPPGGFYASARHTQQMADAALARLRLIEERDYLNHSVDCLCRDPDKCSCGLDELLADLLPPGEGR